MAERGDELSLVTQNIDDLHERAGTSRVIHMHGELLDGAARCEGVRARRRDLACQIACPACAADGQHASARRLVRRDPATHGRDPVQLLRSADLFVAIGTSGAGPSCRPASCAQAGAPDRQTCEIDLEPSDNAELTRTHRGVSRWSPRLDRIALLAMTESAGADR